MKQGSHWKYITVFTDQGFPMVFPLNQQGRLLFKFPKEKPRNLRSMFQDQDILNPGQRTPEDLSPPSSSTARSPETVALKIEEPVFNNVNFSEEFDVKDFYNEPDVTSIFEDDAWNWDFDEAQCPLF